MFGGGESEPKGVLVYVHIIGGGDNCTMGGQEEGRVSVFCREMLKCDNF